MAGMVGILLTLLWLAGATGLGLWALAKPLARLDPAEKLGVAGVAGLGMAGLTLLLVGLLPQGLNWGVFVVAGALLAGLALGQPWKGVSLAQPGPWGIACAALIGLIALQALIGVAAPSTSLDWDSLAYHLAVPQHWLREGQIGYVPALHHSNFPFTVDNLFILGLKFGGEAGAKAFMWGYLVLGCLAVFGLLRRWHGDAAGWTGALGFAAIPIVAWESGTAYIDAAHGLYAALGLAYALEAVWPTEAEEAPESKGLILLSIVMLGWCLGSKFTGLQVLAGAGIALAAGGFAMKEGAKGLRIGALVVCGALALASPWFIKTTLYTGNPVYPFFYSIFGGREWDKWRADIYAEEQASFGVGKAPDRLGHAVLGLGYQPGRYVNPAQQSGGGFPTGAVGVGVILGLIAAAVSGRLDRRGKAALAYVGVGLLLWFVLSQQSRYLTILAMPAVIAAASAAARMKLPLVQGAFAAQALVTIFMIWSMVTQPLGLPVLAGVPAEELRAKAVPAARAAEVVNKLPDGTKVALYDEVFGFLFRHPVMWGNPGHSTLINHEKAQTGAEWAASLRELGITHVYTSLQYQPREGRERWAQAMGVAPGDPFNEAEKQELWADLRQKWRWLLADAARSGDIVFLEQAGPGLLFEVRR